jgi:integrase
MGTKSGGTGKFPHVKGLVQKRTKFGHRWILSAPDISGKIKNITVKISDNDTIEEFFRKVSDARETLRRRESRRSFDSWLDEYITIRQIAKNTEISLRITMRNFGLDNEQNRDSVKKILTSGLSNSTIRVRIGQVNSFFLWLCQKIPELKNPAVDIKLRRTDTPRHRTATNEELSALVARVRSRNDDEYLLFLLLLIHTGARVSSIMALRSNDMDSDNRLRLYNVKAKKQYDYQIPIVNQDVMSLWKKITTDGILWHKDPITYFHRLKTLMDRMFDRDADGEKLSVHSLRHTFATKAVRSGIPVEMVSKMLDHSSINMTLAVYARFSQSQIDDAIQKISKN